MWWGMTVGHDRGARCAYRMALDHPRAVIRLAVLDIVPTSDAFRRADMAFNLRFWVWSFLAAPEPVPEQLIAQVPAVLVNHTSSALPTPFMPSARSTARPPRLTTSTTRRTAESSTMAP